MRKLLPVLLLMVGCDAEPVPPPPKKAPELRDAVTASEAGHHHQSRHGGTLLELGEHFACLDMVLEASTGRVTAYVLDGHADKFIQVEQKEIVLRGKTQSVTLSALGSVLTGEKPGETSQFHGQSDALKDATEFDCAVVRIVIKGREFNDVPLRLKPSIKED